MPSALPSGYPAVLAELTAKVRAAQVRAAVAVNAALVGLYWEVGRTVLAAQVAGGWGARVVDQLAGDLRRTFPTMRGFSRRNLQYMRALAEAWPEGVGEGPLASISWYQHVALLDKLATADERRWYAAQAVEHGWSRNVLAHHIDTDLRGRQGRALTNFSRTLPWDVGGADARPAPGARVGARLRVPGVGREPRARGVPAAVLPAVLGGHRERVPRLRGGLRAPPRGRRGAARAGVRLLAGTDVMNPYVYPGFGLHDELGLLQDAGLTPLEALRTATLNPARYLGAADSLGTVAPGKLADLVLLDADPLADVRNARRVRGVMASGRYLDRAALDAMLAGVRRAATPAGTSPP